MTISASLHFEYAGIKSKDMGIINCHIGKSGLYEDTFMPSFEINEVTIRGRDMPYYTETKRSPLSFTLQLYFKSGITEAKCAQIAQWLNQPYYEVMTFSDDDYTKRYYALPVGDSKFFHNGAKQGYLEISFRNIDCYRYSPVYSTVIYDLSNNVGQGTEIALMNDGHVSMFPVLEITKVGSGEIRIVNASNSGKEFKLSNLVDGEYLEIDNETGDITTSLAQTYRYKDHNGTYLEFTTGNNYLQVYGKCQLKIKYYMKYLN